MQVGTNKKKSILSINPTAQQEDILSYIATSLKKALVPI